MRSIKRLGLVLAAAVAATSLGTAPAQADNPVNVAAKHLPGYQQVPQQEDWWCGPATAYIMIKGMKYYGKIRTTDSQDGETLTQRKLASDKYLEANGGGGTQRDDLAQGLTDWTGRTFRVYSNPSPTTFKNKMMSNFRSGYAVAVAALETRNGPHYNGHPQGKTVDHWVLARAYTTDLKDTHFVDPATSVWSGVNRYFSKNTNTFVNTWVRPSKAIVG